MASKDYFKNTHPKSGEKPAKFSESSIIKFLARLGFEESTLDVLVFFSAH